MAVEYVIYCDGCGARLGCSRHSVRAARASAMLDNGANKGPGGDHCSACRKAMTTLSAEDRARASAAAHSIGTR